MNKQISQMLKTEQILNDLLILSLHGKTDFERETAKKARLLIMELIENQ